MAVINGLYVHVIKESVTEAIDSTAHPVEKGIETTDHVQPKATVISISGKIVDYGTTKASVVKNKLNDFKNKGALVTYTGVQVFSNMMIQNLNTEATSETYGGFDVSMELKEVRIAKSSYNANAQKPIGTQQIVKSAAPASTKVYHTVKKGDTCWALATKKYPSLKPKFSSVMQKCNWMLQQNPHAFSRKGDFKTLQIGKQLYVGDK